MSLNKAYPKIWQLGHKNVAQLFDGVVEVTEKIDGSQFGFGKIDGQVFCRSKNRVLDMVDPDHLFAPAVMHITKIADKIPDNSFWWGETLARPRHNTLAYDRTPHNFIALFGGHVAYVDALLTRYDELTEYATSFDIETVRFIDLLFGAPDNLPEQLDKWLDMTSQLGGTKIEGVVLKNYQQNTEIGGHYVPLLAAKYVSEAFKEKHTRNPKFQTNNLDAIFSAWRTEARWRKAIQHLQEAGQVVGVPEMIGPIIKEIQRDFWEECTDEVTSILLAKYRRQINKTIVRGFPEWFKRDYLLEAKS